MKEKGFEHTEGPWVNAYGCGYLDPDDDETIIIKADRDRLNGFVPTVRDANIRRAVACVNGCDDALVTQPQHIQMAMSALQAFVNEYQKLSAWPEKRFRFEGPYIAARAALRAVRGE